MKERALTNTLNAVLWPAAARIVPANFGNPDKTRNESSTLLSVTRVSLSALGPVPFVQVDICPLNETLIEIEPLAG